MSERLSDEQLATIESAAEGWGGFPRASVRTMARELRLLRSDEWLDKAAEEITATWDVGDHSGPGGSSFERAQAEELAAILRKHRDQA